MDRLPWVRHVFIVSRKDTGYAARFYVTKFSLPRDLKKEVSKTIFENMMRIVKK